MQAQKLRYLSHLMRKLQLRGMHLPSRPSIFSKTQKLQARLEKEVPALMKNLTALNLDCSQLFFKYYLSLFLYSNTHRVLVSRLLELLLLEGEDFITNVLIRLLVECEQHLLEMPANKLVQYLRDGLFRRYFRGVTNEEALQLLEGLVIRRMDCSA